MFNNFKKQLMLVALTLCCSYAYGYDLIVISDSKDKAIKFWNGSEAFDLDAGSVHAFSAVGKNDKLYYNRGGESFAFGSVEIARKFGIFTLDALKKDDFVVIRFDEKTGYAVTIARKDENNAKSQKFDCKHKKVIGTVRYATEVKPFGQEFVINELPRNIFKEIRYNIKLINESKKSVSAYTLSDDLRMALDGIKNNIGELNKISILANIGGEIKFYSLKKWLENREARLVKISKKNVAKRVEERALSENLIALEAEIENERKIGK